MNYRFLAQTPLFQGTSPQEIEAMLACLGSNVRRYEKGQIIYRAGEVIHALGVVLSGSVLIETDDVWGNTTVLDCAGPGQMCIRDSIYNEPKNAFVADFIGESNIIDGIMRADGVVEIFNRRFQCLDKGFEKDEPVDVVIRPEDVDIVDEAAGQQMCIRDRCVTMYSNP